MKKSKFLALFISIALVASSHTAVMAGKNWENIKSKIVSIFTGSKENKQEYKELRENIIKKIDKKLSDLELQGKMSDLPKDLYDTLGYVLNDSGVSAQAYNFSHINFNEKSAAAENILRVKRPFITSIKSIGKNKSITKDEKNNGVKKDKDNKNNDDKKNYLSTKIQTSYKELSENIIDSFKKTFENSENKDEEMDSIANLKNVYKWLDSEISKIDNNIIDKSKSISTSLIADKVSDDEVVLYNLYKLESILKYIKEN